LDQAAPSVVRHRAPRESSARGHTAAALD